MYMSVYECIINYSNEYILNFLVNDFSHNSVNKCETPPKMNQCFDSNIICIIFIIHQKRSGPLADGLAWQKDSWHLSFMFLQSDKVEANIAACVPDLQTEIHPSPAKLSLKLQTAHPQSFQLWGKS